MNPLLAMEALGGVTLVVVLAALLFIEEAGVPLPFAPGDLMLAIGGIAIAAGRVDPVVLVVVIFAATVTGALLGREIFALVGWERLMKLADRLRARAPLERAGELLRRSGWRGVFTARLIPGLRVETTRMAGVTRMPRTTFLAGLLPASVVYIAAFVGLGAAVGRPILALIHEAEHNVLLVALGLVLAIVLILLLRRPMARFLAALAPEGWAAALRVDTRTAGIALISACIGMNFAGRALAVTFKLPLFLDSIGTILSGVLAGPWIGGTVGFVSNLISSNTIDPTASTYSVVSLAIGFAAGMWTRLTWQRRAVGWLALWLICFAIGSLLSAPLNLLFSDGRSGVPAGDALFSWLLSAHVPRAVAAYLGEAAIDLPDKAIAVAGALLIAQGLPQPRAAGRGIDLDLGEAFMFMFTTPRWRRRLLVAAGSLLLFWLVVPLLWFMGYTVEVARWVRGDRFQLPPWDHLRHKAGEGFVILAVFVLWSLPGIIVSIPVGVAGDSGASNPGIVVLNALGSLWGLVVLMATGPIYGQYLQGGFRAAFDVPAIAQRIRANFGLAIIVGALIVVLSTVWVVGVVALGIGVLVTLAYASFVSAYLVGKYAAATDPASDCHPPPGLARDGRVGASPPAAVPRESAS